MGRQANSHHRDEIYTGRYRIFGEVRLPIYLRLTTCRRWHSSGCTTLPAAGGRCACWARRSVPRRGYFGRGRAGWGITPDDIPDTNNRHHRANKCLIYSCRRHTRSLIASRAHPVAKLRTRAVSSCRRVNFPAGEVSVHPEMFRPWYENASSGRDRRRDTTMNQYPRQRTGPWP